ncbi:hypothetical protein DERF_010801 [Dermatophagoides farinae]|uniref:Uncharacterized protein n=1 Tax=Dermatophagoides farinae TaxID=6954 RepID=A0A922HTN6_DERFA|nr:hypothetical protein DERF_010801 [Dermatophagoides farinae]
MYGYGINLVIIIVFFIEASCEKSEPYRINTKDLNKFFNIKYNGSSNVVRDDDYTMVRLDQSNNDNGRMTKQTDNDSINQRKGFQRKNIETIPDYLDLNLVSNSNLDHNSKNRHSNDRCRCVCDTDRFESFEFLLPEIINLKMLRNITKYAPNSNHLQRLFNSFIIAEHNVKRPKTTSNPAIIMTTTTRQPEVLSPPSLFSTSTSQPLITSPVRWQRRAFKLGIPFLATAMLTKIFGHNYSLRRSSPKAKRFDENQWSLPPKSDEGENIQTENLLYWPGFIDVRPIVLNSDDIQWSSPSPLASSQFIQRRKDTCHSQQQHYYDYDRR